MVKEIHQVDYIIGQWNPYKKKTAYVASTMQHSVEYDKIQFIIIAKLITKTVSQIKILVKKIYEFQQVWANVVCDAPNLDQNRASWVELMICWAEQSFEFNPARVQPKVQPYVVLPHKRKAIES